MERQINGYKVERLGGFITVKHWMVYDKDDVYQGAFFKFGTAKEACLNEDFSGAYKGRVY